MTTIKDLDPLQIELTELIEVRKNGDKVYRGSVEWINFKGKIMRSTRICTVKKGQNPPSDSWIEKISRIWK